MNLTRLGHVMTAGTFPEFNINSFNTHHIMSKAWLLSEMAKLKKAGKIDIDDKSAAILGGGSAIWADDLIELFPTIGKVRSFDIDFAHEPQANRFNATWWKVNRKFAACTVDVNTLDWSGPTTFKIKDVDYQDYEQQTIDFGVIINPSTQHMSMEWASNIRSNKLLVLQSNDYVNSELKSSIDLANKFGITNVLYQGGIGYPVPEDPINKYKRFMVIGYR